MQPPWTELGRLESDIRDLQRMISGKVDGWEATDIKSKLTKIQSDITTISNGMSDLQSRLSFLENIIIREPRIT